MPQNFKPPAHRLSYMLRVRIKPSQRRLYEQVAGGNVSAFVRDTLDREAKRIARRKRKLTVDELLEEYARTPTVRSE